MSAPVLPSGTPLAAPRLVWDGDQPRAADFDDIYHARDGAAETRRVFLAPADLPQRWQGMQRFTVAEFGFGTGLNLAVLLDAWRAQRSRLLQYISIERYPLDHAQWQRLCSARQGTLPAYRELAALYPPTVSGWHHRRLPAMGLSLHLYFGGAAQALGELDAQGFRSVDAWWLDGFAPDQNPELWTPQLLARLAPLSAPGATVTTFTAAGRVRRALSEGGFEMRRVDQRPHKRESLAGVLRTHRPAALPAGLAAARRRAASAGVAIVGAGIAGTSLAYELAQRGQRCELQDSGAAPLGASTLAGAVAHSRLLADGSPAAAVRLAAQLHSQAWLREWPAWQPSGVLQLAAEPTVAARQRALADRYAGSGRWLECLSRAALTERFAHTANPSTWLPAEVISALWLAETGALAGPALLSWLRAAAQVQCRWQQPYRAPRTATATDSAVAAPVTVLCHGAGLRQHPAARYLELAPLGGQLDRETEGGPIALPPVPLVGSTYQIPTPVIAGASGAGSAELVLGASYEYRPWAPQQATAHNRDSAGVVSSSPAHRWQRSMRTVSSDRLPVAGMLHTVDAQPLPELWTSAGHGSHGFTTAPLCAAHLASLLTGTAPVLGLDIAAAIDPLRFRVRQARRGYRFGASD